VVFLPDSPAAEEAVVDGGISNRAAAENQSLYRSTNERMKELNEVFEEVASVNSEWICECADTECTLRVSATLDEYEAVRLNSRTFLVYPGHVYPEVERVVRENERFTIVKKIGESGKIAEQLDPRGPRMIGNPRRA
jgi:hypothetical protein